MPFMNVIAGILIGVFNDSWLARLAVPFLWGIVFCVYVLLRERARYEGAAAKREIGGEKARWGLSHTGAFYLVEYATGTATSLVFSVIAGLVKGLF